MRIRQLKIFLAVCDHKSMTQAAKALYFSEPTVSQAIAELESTYGVRFFERLNHRLYLTAAGERLRSYARHILNLDEQVQKELAQQKEAGTVRIGASLTIGTYLLPRLISAFREKMPQAEIFTRVANANVIQQMILEDRIDIALIESPVSSADIVEKSIRDDELVIICSPRHPLSQKSVVTKADIAGLSFIVREPGSGTRAIFESAMRDAGLPWNIVGIYNNTEAIKHAVKADLGLAVVSKFSIEDELKAKSICLIRVRGMRLGRKFNFIYHRQKFFTTAMQVLMASCVASCQE